MPIDVVHFSDLIGNEHRLRKFISYFIPISYFFGGDTYQNVLCPFHMDSTPSAKLFRDEDNTSRLFCFACRRQFTSYDYIKKVIGKNPVLYLREIFPEEKLDSEAIYFARNVWDDFLVEPGMSWQAVENNIRAKGVVEALKAHYQVTSDNYE